METRRPTYRTTCRLAARPTPTAPSAATTIHAAAIHFIATDPSPTLASAPPPAVIPSPVDAAIPCRCLLSVWRSGAEVDKVELDISAQYTRIYPYSCRSCVFLMYSVHAPKIIMCLNNSLRSGYNVIRAEILCLSLSDSRNRLCATTTVWGSPCDAAGEQDANVGYQICDRGWTFATERETCLAHLSRMPGPRREGVWVSAA